LKIRNEILKQATHDVADRQGHYGDPKVNYDRCALLWAAYDHCTEGRNLATDAILKMILVQVARLIEDPSHAGGWTNIAGYAAIGGEVGNSSE
jgi:hypothetical protein